MHPWIQNPLELNFDKWNTRKINPSGNLGIQENACLKTR